MATKNEIKKTQCLLYYLGYYVCEVDGIWGQLSKTATKAFQKDFGGLADNGVADNATVKALKHAVAYGMPAKKQETESKDFWADIKYFKKSEFKCKCGKHCNGYPVEPKEKLVRVADRVRSHFGAACTVSSGIRCEKHNAAVGGVANSRHKEGKAMDFCIAGKTAAQVLEYVQKQPEIRYAYAINKTYVHMDIE